MKKNRKIVIRFKSGNTIVLKSAKREEKFYGSSKPLFVFDCDSRGRPIPRRKDIYND